MDGDLHTAILDEDMMDSISHFGKTPSDTSFQQDSDPKAHLQKGQGLVQKQQHSSHTMSNMVSRPQSHQVPLAAPQEEAWC